MTLNIVRWYDILFTLCMKNRWSHLSNSPHIGPIDASSVDHFLVLRNVPSEFSPQSNVNTGRDDSGPQAGRLIRRQLVRVLPGPPLSIIHGVMSLRPRDRNPLVGAVAGSTEANFGGDRRGAARVR